MVMKEFNHIRVFQFGLEYCDFFFFSFKKCLCEVLSALSYLQIATYG